jgi:hypothetical protein
MHGYCAAIKFHLKVVDRRSHKSNNSQQFIYRLKERSAHNDSHGEKNTTEGSFHAHNENFDLDLFFSSNPYKYGGTTKN